MDFGLLARCIFAHSIGQSCPHAKPGRPPFPGQTSHDIKTVTMSPISLGVEVTDPHTFRHDFLAEIKDLFVQIQKVQYDREAI
jgi:hypothetical protein